MAFIIIKGTFHPALGRPDGDSVRFKPANAALLKKLEGKPAVPSASGTTKGTVQLRLEGIDAIEKAATKPLSTEARDSLRNLLGFDANNNATPAGFILARMTDDKSGRPICFVFKGGAPAADGAKLFLDEKLLRKSVNLAQAKAGYAYPLYYNTLFASLRSEFDAAIKTAKASGLGYWPNDATLKGITVKKKTDLATVKPIWPKLWRRLEEWFRSHSSLAGFHNHLTQSNERIDLLDTMEERGLQDVVKVTGNKVKLLVEPSLIRVVGKAGRRKR